MIYFIYKVGESYVEIDEDCKVELNITNGTYFASIEDDETDITITEEELDSRETLAQRLDALEALVASNNTISNIFLKSHAVGSIYTTVATDEDTASKMHDKYGGEWEAYGSGKTLVGVDTSQTEFNMVDKTGGEKAHILTASEMPSHWHTVKMYLNQTGSGFTMPSDYAYYNYTSQGVNIMSYTNSSISDINVWNIGKSGTAGESQAHNNLQPYITVYMWKRTS